MAIVLRKEKDVERWLNTIADEEHRRAAAVVIALRAALRVAPLLGRRGKRRPAGALRDIVPLYFRAMATPWVAAKYPTHGAEIRDAAAFADVGFADAAYVAAARATALTIATRAAAFAVAARAAAVAAVAAFAVAAARAAAVWRAISADAEMIERDGVHSARDSVLWPDGGPGPFDADWMHLKKRLPSDEHWDIWFAWYEALCDGHDPNWPEAAAVEIVTLPDEEWKKGPASVNARIKDILAKHRGPGAIDTLDLTQRPSGFTFKIDNGKIVAQAVLATIGDPATFADIWSEVREKARTAKERLGQTQAPRRVQDTVDRLIAALGDSPADLKPGILLMRSRSLEADVAVYQTEDGRKELLEDAQAMLADLAASLDDLKAAIPEIMNIEAARMAQGFVDASAVEAYAAIRQIYEVAKASKEVVDSSSLYALDAPRPDIEETSRVLESTKDLATREKATKKRAELVAQGVLIARNFVVKPLAASGRFVGKATVKGLEKGIEEVVSAATKTGIGLLIHSLAGPAAALAFLVLSWRPLAKALKDTTDEPEKQQRPPDPDAPVDT